MGDFPFNTLLHLLPKKHMPPRSIAQVTFWDDSSLSFYENNIWSYFALKSCQICLKQNLKTWVDFIMKKKTGEFSIN